MSCCAKGGDGAASDMVQSLRGMPLPFTPFPAFRSPQGSLRKGRALGVPKGIRFGEAAKGRFGLA